MLGGRPPGPASVSETTCLLIYIQDDQSQGNQRAPTMAGHAPLFSGSLQSGRYTGAPKTQREIQD